MMIPIFAPSVRLGGGRLAGFEGKAVAGGWDVDTPDKAEVCVEETILEPKMTYRAYQKSRPPSLFSELRDFSPHI